ncbi:disease resistance RPP13-like protein 4 [Fagus crenata]
MPKGLASLSELQVLKGFVIGNLESDRDNTHLGLPQPFLGGLCFPQNRDLCTLEDLIGLKKLSKLSINTRSKAFPTEKELKALRKLEALRKLAIAWSVDSKKKENGAAKPTRAPSRLNRIITGLNRIITGMRRDTETPELPTKLEKLKLQCFPHTGTPDWLIPRKLERLKKLYIRGGKLINLGQTQEGNENWKVEILRLKHLHEFNMDWNKLQRSFPELKLLENVNCPKLTSNQCDQFGVWLKH